MDLANYWFSSGSVTGHDAGDPIGQSLRFRAPSYDTGSFLYKTGWADSGNVWTFSCWLKGWLPWSPTVGAQDARIFSCHTNGGNQTVDEVYFFGNWPGTGRNEICHYMQGSANGYQTSHQEVNDSSAWYHLVWRSKSMQDVTIWINGVQVTDWRDSTYPFSSQNFVNKNCTWSIGARGPGNTSPLNIQYNSNGYMAAVYFIDGQGLDPTTFGRYNDSDVWVPVAPTGLTYGTNGFHLDFSDPNDLGADRSGNGNNFIATGFNTDPPGTPGNIFTQPSPANLQVAASTDLINPIPFTMPGNTGEIYDVDAGAVVESFTNRFSSNNTSSPRALQVWTSVDGAQNSWVMSEEVVFPAGTNTEFSFTTTPATPSRWYRFAQVSSSGAAWASGVYNLSFLSGTGLSTDYDLMQDSPTQSYATLNPVIQQKRANLFHANLGVGTPNAGGTDPEASATMYIQGKSYFEVTLESGNSTLFIYLLPDDDLDSSGIAKRILQTNADPSVAATADVRNADGTVVLSAATTASASKVWGFAVDTTTGNVDVFLDGTLFASASGYTGNRLSHAVINGQTAAWKFYFNYGQKPFRHTPPAGFEPLQTQNLPNAPIVNGRDHFRAITGPGSGVAAGTFPNQLKGNWTQFLTAPGGFQPSPYDRSTAFSDRNASSSAADPNAVITFEPDTPIPFTTHFRFCSNHTNASPGEFSFNNGPWTTITDGFAGHTRSDYATNGQTIATGPGQLESFRVRRLENADTPAIFWMQIDDDIMVDNGILAVAQNIFPNGLWWIKDRTLMTGTGGGSAPAEHRLVDSVRGTDVRLSSSSQSAETAYIAPTNESVAWCWSAPTEFTNAAGDNGATIASTGRVNTEAGFSIVTYTGTGVAGTVNHGLSDTPDWYIVKRRSPGGSDWRSYHIGLPNPADEYIAFNQSDGLTKNNGWNNTLPTNQVFSINTPAALNTNGDNYVAYCWHAVPGYSAFGNYTGNGNADGPFIYLGFKPAFLMIKQRNTGTGGWWQIRDNVRDPTNPANTELYANNSNRENGQGTRELDLLSNGFKIRTGTNAYNQSNNVFLYCAFAENPFGGSNVVPATAR